MSPVDEHQKLAALTRMRLFAGGLLVVMALAFLAARHWQPAYPILAYLESFTEAAMVGGLADWFAVTALFRHPLGLPIPHTAIVPRNKDRIGAAVGNFVTNNFLSPEVVASKLRALDVAIRLASWLEKPGVAEAVARRGAGMLPPLLAAVEDAPLRQLLGEAASTRLRKMPAGPLMARLLKVLSAGGQHLVLFDLALATAGDFLAKNRPAIHRTIAEKSSWWVPEWIDARLAEKIIDGILETLAAMATPGHPWREQFEAGFAETIEHLAHAPETRARAEALKAEIIAHPEVQAYLQSLWAETKQAISDDLQSGGGVERVLRQSVLGLGARLVEDKAFAGAINDWARRAILRLIVPNRDAIGGFMTSVVMNWDSRTLVGKLEAQFGRDLQYIRINGTLVGGLVGLLIHLVGQWSG